MNVARTIRWTLPVLLLCAAGTPLWAEHELAAFIEPEGEIQVDRALEFVIQVSGDSNPDIPTPRLPELTNLQPTGGPSRRISSNWVNGRFSAKVELRYNLTPKNVGAAEIPPIDLLIDGKSYRTDAIRFTVGAVPTSSPPSAAPSSAERTYPKSSAAQVFLRAEIAAGEVWVGQSVPLSVSLYADGRIGSPAWRGQPQLSSFWVEELDVDTEAEAHSKTERGTRYIVYPLQRKVLVPQTPGEFEIEPFVLQLQIRGRGSDPFDIFSLSRGDTIVRRTDPLALKVKPLPTAGRPEAFGGAVGKYEFSVSLDRTESAVNDAVALVATVEGDGFLLSVSPPVLAAPAGVKLFDPEVRSTSRGRDGRLVSSKSWEWLLVPSTPGEIQLAPMEFHFFDPDTGRYRTLRQTFEPLLVRQSDLPPDGPLTGGEIRVLQRDLAFIKPLDGPLRVGQPRTRGHKLYFTLLLLPLVWAPLWVLMGRRWARLRQDQGLARSRKAGRRARASLRSARKSLESEQGSEFHEAVAHALVEYVADRFDRAPAGLTHETVDDLLALRGLDESLRKRLRACLESCDFARFVPDAAYGERRAELLSEAESIIDQLEKAL